MTMKENSFNIIASLIGKFPFKLNIEVRQAIFVEHMS